MTAYYVRSGAAGAGTGADWANAYTTLSAAMNSKAAGDTFYVSEDHNESAAAQLVLSFPGVLGNPVKVICVNHLGSVPPASADLRTTGVISNTGANNIVMSGAAKLQGLTLNNGTGVGSTSFVLGSAANSHLIFENCALKLVASGAGSTFLLGNGGFVGSVVELINTPLSFAATGQKVTNAGVSFKWRDTLSALLGTIPTTLFDWNGAARSGIFELNGIDLSAAGAGKTLFGNSATNCGVARVVDCKINASVTKASTPSSPGGQEIDFVRCDSSGVNYSTSLVRYAGTLDHETAIVRTGGASDGTTPISWKVVTSANANLLEPFVCPPIAIWNDVSGSLVTATVEGVWGGGAVPNDDEIWIEVEYLGSSGSPQGSFVNDSKADILAAGTGQTGSSETWGGSTTKFKLGVTFTPQQKGWILARVKAAKASSTFYIDPKVTLT